MAGPTGALGPYRVLDLTTNDGWLCGKILADLGADVVKVEPPGGDPGRRLGPFAGDRAEDPEASLPWWFANRGKRSVVVDLAVGPTDAEDETFAALLSTADVLVESFGPGGLAARGWPVERLAAHNPRLVVTSISPFGQDGPYRDRRGPDLVVAALGGLMWLTGDPDRPPLRISAPQLALHASAEAALHTLVALTDAVRSGAGQHVDVSAQAAGVRTTMNTTDFRLLEGWEVTRLGPGVAYAPGRPRQIYACADGHVTYMAAIGPLGGPGLVLLRQWAEQDGIDVPDLLADADFCELTYAELDRHGRTERFIVELEAMVEGVFASRTKEELYRTAIEHLLLLAPVNTVADLRLDDQLAARRYWQTVAVGGTDGDVTFPGPWARLAATPLHDTPRAPRVDEHGEALRAELRARSVGGGTAAAPAADVATAAPAARLPFEGLKVWDMSWVGVGPLTARYLADYGATVVRLDNSRRTDVLRAAPPFADGRPGINRSQFYADFNASKLGVGIDLDVPDGRRVARRLAAWADVVIESFTPKTLRALGLHYDELKALNPALVMLSTCMQGQTGPRANYRGFGQLMASLAGFYEITGWPDRNPAMIYGAYTDFVCQRFCATALVAALDHRRRSGEGQHLDVAQFEVALQFLGPQLLDHEVNGRVATRHGNRDERMVPHGVYPCRPAGPGREAERWLALACEDDGQWSALVGVMGRPSWATDPQLADTEGRRAREDELDERMAAWTSGQARDELVSRLQPLVAAAPVRSPGELLDDPQLRHRGYFPVLDHTVMGPVPYNGMQALLTRTPGRLSKAAPCVGEDTWTVLTELLGYDEDEAARLLAAGAVEVTVG